jgi:hypothetical protein
VCAKSDSEKSPKLKRNTRSLLQTVSWLKVKVEKIFLLMVILEQLSSIKIINRAWGIIIGAILVGRSSFRILCSLDIVH